MLETSERETSKRANKDLTESNVELKDSSALSQSTNSQDDKNFKLEKIEKLQDDIQRYLQQSEEQEEDNRIDLPMLMDDAWIHQRIDQNQGSSVIIMRQSERSDFVTNRLRLPDEHN